MSRFFVLVVKLMFLSSGTLKICSGMSYLYIGRSSRGRLTYQIAGNCHFCGLFGGSPYNYPRFYVASTREETNPGASGQVQDHQEHHRDDQEQLLDNFLEVFMRI